MSTLVTVATELAAAAAAAAIPERNPVVVYIARTREASRAVTRSRLRMLLGVLAAEEIDDARVIAFPWSRLEPAHCAALSSAVATRYAPSTARALLVVLKGLVRACWTVGAYSLEEVERRTTAFARVTGERLPPGSALSPVDVSRMHLAAGPRDRLMLAVLFGAGLRRSEAASLTWDRFDGAALRLIGKGDRERLVPLPRWALEALLEHRRAEGAMLTRRTIHGGDTTEAITANGIYVALRSLGARAGVRLSPHDARRTFISELLDVADTVVVSKLAGHASPAQTARYDRRGDRAARDAVARLRPMNGA